MHFYRFIDSLGWPKSYLAKILLVSFVGVHIPMIGAVFYVAFLSEMPWSSVFGLGAALLVATVVGTLMTCLAMWAMLAPVREAARGIDGYLHDGAFPSLPTQHTDEAGTLMRNIQEGVTRLDAAIDAANARREAAERERAEKFEMLAGMSHELRTPLNHIIGFSEMLSNEMLGPLGQDAYKDYAGEITSSGGQLLALVQSLLELSDIEAMGEQARGEAESEPVDLAEAIKRAAAQQTLHAQSRAIAVAFTESAAPVVRANPRALKQSVMTFMEFCVQSAPEQGEVAVEIARERSWGVLRATFAEPLLLDDTPPELRGGDAQFTAYSNANAGEDAIASVSPKALRLSLINSLARLQGGSVKAAAQAVAGRDGTRLELWLPLIDAFQDDFATDAAAWAEDAAAETAEKTAVA